MHQFGGKFRKPIELTLRITIIEGDVLSFCVSKLTQRQPNRLGTPGISSGVG